MSLSTEYGEHMLSSSKVSPTDEADLLVFEAEKKLWIKHWLEELQLAQGMSLCMEEVVRCWDLEEVDCLLV